MCGFAGFLSHPVSLNEGKNVLERMASSLALRGPDDQGLWLSDSGTIGLAHRRLSFLDLGQEGHQPMVSSTGRFVLVFNGEIYNYRELRQELEQSGIHCRSSSESEVIINLYSKLGLDFISKLNGMFAIAIHDARDNSLHLIRDRMGKKPLWISQLNDGTLLFASEVRALMLARPDRTLRTEMVAEVMQYGYINAPDSAFNEIGQLPPASMLTQSLPHGGISGKPIEKKSNDMIKFIGKLTDNKFPVIGSGGIYDYDSAQRKLDAGAVLLQIYTSFIYEGPTWPYRLAKRMPLAKGWS